MTFAEADAFNLAVRTLALRHRARAHELLAPLGLHPGQEFLLMELRERGPRVQTQLATALSCAPPSISLMVRKLEVAGYVHKTRQPSDLRAQLIELTESGLALTDQLRLLWVTLASETIGDTVEYPPQRLAEILNSLAASLRPAPTEVTIGEPLAAH